MSKFENFFLTIGILNFNLIVCGLSLPNQIINMITLFPKGIKITIRPTLVPFTFQATPSQLFIVYFPIIPECPGFITDFNFLSRGI